MKIINTILAGICMLSLTACDDLRNWNSSYLSGGTLSLSDKDGTILDCRGDTLSLTGKPKSEAERFWQDNNLPKGNTDFVCKDRKAYLTSKVTDCQGNLITKQSGGIAQFKINNNFPRYSSGEIALYTAFKCQGSKVIPIDYTKK